MSFPEGGDGMTLDSMVMLAAGSTILGLRAWIFWLILAGIFLVIEAATVNLVTIWFVAGSLAAVIVALLGGSPLLQLAVMAVLSLILLALFWRYRDKMRISVRTAEATNADRVVGKTGKVTEIIDPVRGTGKIQVLGQVWSAVTEDEEVLEAGREVTVLRLRGVKVIVKPKN